jgi:hypothetical protein
MRVNTNIMVTTVAAITEQSNVIIIMREPRDTLHRHHLDTTAMTSVLIRVWLAVL